MGIGRAFHDIRHNAHLRIIGSRDGLRRERSGINDLGLLLFPNAFWNSKSTPLSEFLDVKLQPLLPEWETLLHTRFCQIVFFLLPILFSTQLGFGQTPPEAYDFRQVSWGLNVDAVKAAEQSTTLVQEGQSPGPDFLAYSMTVEDNPTPVDYVFAPGKLIRAKYLFNEIHNDKNLYLTDFSRVKDSLIEQYGLPSKDEKIWSGSPYKDRKDSWGHAVAHGKLIIYAQWEADATSIILVLSCDSFDEVKHQLEYASKKLRPLEVESKKHKP